MTRLRCAILDDYFDLTSQLADWSKIEDRIEITAFNRPFASPEAAAGALKDFEIICAMRERTPFPRTLFAALPRLKILITSGLAIAVRIASRRRVITLSGTRCGVNRPAQM